MAAGSEAERTRRPLHQRLGSFLRHRWLDAGDARRALRPDAVLRLRDRVAASERRHTGQIRICVEGSLPASYLWRHLRGGIAMRALVRQRAVMMFSKLRVWDTERNNGVLIYLLIAERAIEIVADRGLTHQIGSDVWDAMVQRLADALRVGAFEEGLTQAIGEVTMPLARCFPRAADGAAADTNELPDTPVVR